MADETGTLLSQALTQPMQIAALGNDVPVQLVSNMHGPIFTGTALQAREFAKQQGIPISPQGSGGSGYFLQRIKQGG